MISILGRDRNTKMMNLPQKIMRRFFAVKFSFPDSSQMSEPKKADDFDDLPSHQDFENGQNLARKYRRSASKSDTKFQETSAADNTTSFDFENLNKCEEEENENFLPPHLRHAALEITSKRQETSMDFPKDSNKSLNHFQGSYSRSENFDENSDLPPHFA